jgi:hypothetical protein
MATNLIGRQVIKHKMLLSEKTSPVNYLLKSDDNESTGTKFSTKTRYNKSGYYLQIIGLFS